YLLCGLTFLVNLAETVFLRPYIRLVQKIPAFLAADVLFCLFVYDRSNIWSSPFQFYSYSSLLMPVTLFFFSGAMGSTLFFLCINFELLYLRGYTFANAQRNGYADTYLMQLAIVPLMAFVLAYPNRLYARLRETQQRLDIVAREQMLVAERTRIAQSLHDSVAQMLFGIGMLSESALARLAERNNTPAPAEVTRAVAVAGEPAADGALADALRQVRDLAARGNREMRSAIYALNDPDPSRRGLIASLRELVAETAARAGVDAHLSAPGLPEAGAAPGASPPPAPVADLTLPDAVAQALYKVAREALANAEKHSGAANIWVTVETPAPGRSGWLTLRVRDDGRGFHPPLLAVPGNIDIQMDDLHFGLQNMRLTLEAVGGRLDISSALGNGTTVVAEAPLG
ncbi:MAG TPA: sensor histidine kinase, partial [Ktedonobacterales bacterium]|nr:sensor histidine kinase [Ktedonobacterales bacterium]